MSFAPACCPSSTPLRPDRRHVVPFNVTAHPTADGAAPQVAEAFPFQAYSLDSTKPKGLGRGRPISPHGLRLVASGK